MNTKKNHSHNSTIVFFIDTTKFETEKREITARELLSTYAEEDPEETTLALRHGNDITKYTEDDAVICLENGMHFIVFHNGPTTVSFFGPERLIAELKEVGYEAELVEAQGNSYAILRNYEVPVGRFAGKKIDLGIPATSNFPISVGTSIHVRSTPQLFEKTDSITNVRNITDSQLGPEWRYWSRNFNWQLQKKKDARRLMSQIAGVFNCA